MAFQILRVEKLGTPGEIAASASHTYRERQTKNADPSRSHLNQFFGVKGSDELQTKLAERLVGVKKDAQSVRMLEYMVTASPEWFADASSENIKSYFQSSFEWFKKKHGADCVLGAALHLDEKTPHMCVYVTPVVKVEGKNRKRSVNCTVDEEHPKGRKTIEVFEPEHERLSAKSFCDNNKKKVELLSEMQTDFHEKVGKKFGLERGVKGSEASHERVKRFYGELEPKIQAAEAVISAAETIKKQQEKEAEELKKKRVENEIVAAEINKKVKVFNQSVSDFRAEKSAFQEQKARFSKAIGQVFDMLPASVQSKFAEILGPVLQRDTKAEPTRGAERAPDAALGALGTLRAKVAEKTAQGSATPPPLGRRPG